MRPSIASVFFALSCSTALAQWPVYDAGTAGNPHQAPSPTQRGWTEVITGSCAAQGLSPEPGTTRNAWQVFDPGPGRVWYGAEFEYSALAFDVEVELLPIAGSFWLQLDKGDFLSDGVHDLELRIEGNDIEVYGDFPSHVTCVGAVDGAYHTFRFSGFDYLIDVFVDGVFCGQVSAGGAVGPSVPGEGVRWGSIESQTRRAHVRRVDARPQGYGPVGVVECTPATPHSAGIPARIEAMGKTVASQNALRLRAYDLPVDAFVFFLASETPGSSPMAGGSQGTLCLSGSIGRYVGPNQIRRAGSLGSVDITVDLRHIPTSPNSAVVAGETWRFQAWFRDANPTPTSNFTDAIAVTF